MNNLTHLTITAAQERRRRLYDRLRARAARREPCPGNDALAAVTGFASCSGVKRALSDLEDEGLIEVERRSNQRRVTICATGERTAIPPAWIEPPLNPRRPVREIAAKAIELSGRPRRDILGRSRFKEHVRVRQVIFDFAVREGWPLSHAGRVMGYDHSTVCHALRVLPYRARQEPDTAALIAAMARALPPRAGVAA